MKEIDILIEHQHAIDLNNVAKETFHAKVDHFWTVGVNQLRT